MGETEASILGPSSLVGKAISVPWGILSQMGGVGVPIPLTHMEEAEIRYR